MIDLKEQAGIAMNVRGQLSDPIADPQVTLGALAFAGDLGRLLWRMKYGQDFRLRDSEGRTAIHRATLLLSKRLRDAGKFNRSKYTGVTRAAKKASALSGKKVERETVDIIERFAHRAIVEWIADLCPTCNGNGVSGRGDTRQEKRVACSPCGGHGSVCVDEYRIPFAHRADGRGPMLFREIERCEPCLGTGRVTVFVTGSQRGRQICGPCQGTGRRAIDHIARAHALGVPLEQYRSNWQAHFYVVLALLDAIDGSASDTMRRKLQR